MFKSFYYQMKTDYKDNLVAKWTFGFSVGKFSLIRIDFDRNTL